MERNVTLDFVRGVAILGILLLNISAFGLLRRGMHGLGHFLISSAR